MVYGLQGNTRFVCSKIAICIASLFVLTGCEGRTPPKVDLSSLHGTWVITGYHDGKETSVGSLGEDVAKKEWMGKQLQISANGFRFSCSQLMGCSPPVAQADDFCPMGKSEIQEPTEDIALYERIREKFPGKLKDYKYRVVLIPGCQTEHIGIGTIYESQSAPQHTLVVPLGSFYFFFTRK